MGGDRADEGLDSSGPDLDEERIDEPSETMAREAVEPEIRPWPIRKLSIDDPDPPGIVAALGQLGVYLGVVAVALAVVGVVAGSLRVQPLGNVAIFFSLVLVSVAMGLGIAFQIYVIRG